MGPFGISSTISSPSLSSHSIDALISESRSGVIPNSKSNWPPYFLGMLLGSISSDNVSHSCPEGTMQILLTVFWSNHLLIYDHTVGKNEGAPITLVQPVSNKFSRLYTRCGRDTHIGLAECLGVVSGCQRACGLHVIFQSPELEQSDVGYVDDTRSICNWFLRGRARLYRRTKRQHEANQILVGAEQAQHLFGLSMGRIADCGRAGLAIRRHDIGCQVCNLKPADGRAISVSTTNPMSILCCEC